MKNIIAIIFFMILFAGIAYANQVELSQIEEIIDANSKEWHECEQKQIRLQRTNNALRSYSDLIKKN